MIKKFIKLEWKSFTRSASFSANLAIKIILGIVGAIYALAVLTLGVTAFYGLKKSGMEPLSAINHYLIYWWAADLVARYFIQKTPIMFVKPFLPQPISKKKLTHYLLGKSAFSFFNFYPLFFFLPFSVTLLYNGYSIIGVICWNLAMMAISYFNNYLNLAVNNKDGIFISLAVVLVSFATLQYYHVLDVTIYTAPIFQSFYAWRWTMLIMVGIMILLYRYNYNYFLKSLFLDDIVQKRVKEADSREYTWLERFGLMGTFMKNDLRLILRNKRSKNTILISFLFLFYGLLFANNPAYQHSSAWLIFIGIFISGAFLFTFGNYVPSWDSAYYPLMMSQNIKYKEYLASKWWLMVVATIASMILSVFYLYFGTKYYLAIVAGGIYNIGFNGYIVLLSGAYTKTPIDLSVGKKPFGDKKAFNAKTILLTIPKLLLPIIIFYIFEFFFNDTAGFTAISVIGILGLLFRNKAFAIIEKIYKSEKYKTLQAYKQK